MNMKEECAEQKKCVYVLFECLCYDDVRWTHKNLDIDRVSEWDRDMERWSINGCDANGMRWNFVLEKPCK